MPSSDHAQRLVQAAEKAIDIAVLTAIAKKDDREPRAIAARAAVLAVLRVLAEIAPGTPEYAVEFDFDGLADQIEEA